MRLHFKQNICVKISTFSAAAEFFPPDWPKISAKSWQH